MIDRPHPEIAAALAAAGRLRHRLDREAKVADRLFRRLIAGRPPGAPLAAHPRRRHRLLAFCDRLLAESRKTVFEHPRQALELARLAAGLGVELDVATYGPALRHDLTGRAWGRVGNALRVLGDHRAAAAAFASARAELERGSGDLLVEAELLDLEASLSSSQRRYSEAARRLDRVIGIYRRLADPHRLGRAMISAGTVRGDAGELERAITLLRSGLEQIDSHHDPRLEMCGRHNLVLYLDELGRSAEADELLLESNAEVTASTSWAVLRRRWAEGRIALRRGEPGSAERALREVREGFAQLDLPYDAALVTLDLVVLLAEQGRTAEVKRLAAETLPIFHACAVDREALMALTAFTRAAERETATAAMTRTLARALGRRRQPGARRAAPSRLDG